MWFTAILGMSSAFIESSLAQLFKVRDSNSKQFRGGPAYYITQGLRSKTFGVILHLPSFLLMVLFLTQFKSMRLPMLLLMRGVGIKPI
jgi:Na+/alanine symporter